MQEELKQVREDIQELQNRLSILQKRKQSILDKIEVPTELIGKYIKNINDLWTTYIRIDKIVKEYNRFIIYGPKIIKETKLIRISYNLDSYSYFMFENSEEFEIITKEEYEKELENAIEKFK